MRIAIASIGQETCSFTSARTTVDTFRHYGLYEGAEILSKCRGVGPIGGFLTAAAEEVDPVVPLPIIHAWAGANGPLTPETVTYFEEKLAAGLQAALPVDGFFFSQHGAAAALNVPDVEGHLLQVARRVLGPDVPIVMPFDHHANITQAMMAHVDGLVGHRTQPHDPLNTGLMAARMLFALVRREYTPTIAWRKIPLITHQEQFLTSSGPMQEWFDMARWFETLPGVISVSTCPMQPWLDVPEGGWAAIVITDNDRPLAERLVTELADKAWSMRERFWHYASIPVRDAVRRAVAAPRGLVVLSDTGDSVFGGATGDSTVILTEMLHQQVEAAALVPMVDPAAVQIAVQAGVGSEITLPLGGKLDPFFGKPVTVTAAVVAVGGGWLQAEVIGVDSFDMGTAVLLQAGSIQIVVSEHVGVGGNHPVVYRHFGIEPAQAQMVVVKTASNFQYYRSIMSELLRVDTLGPTTSHLEQFPWQRLPRPIYPLDPLPDWKA